MSYFTGVTLRKGKDWTACPGIWMDADCISVNLELPAIHCFYCFACDIGSSRAASDLFRCDLDRTFGRFFSGCRGFAVSYLNWFIPGRTVPGRFIFNGAVERQLQPLNPKGSRCIIIAENRLDVRQVIVGNGDWCGKRRTVPGGIVNFVADTIETRPNQPGFARAVDTE